jgi:hypothetical protein
LHFAIAVKKTVREESAPGGRPVAGRDPACETTAVGQLRRALCRDSLAPAGRKVAGTSPPWRIRPRHDDELEGPWHRARSTGESGSGHRAVMIGELERIQEACASVDHVQAIL